MCSRGLNKSIIVDSFHGTLANNRTAEDKTRIIRYKMKMLAWALLSSGDASTVPLTDDFKSYLSYQSAGASH